MKTRAEIAEEFRAGFIAPTMAQLEEVVAREKRDPDPEKAVLGALVADFIAHVRRWKPEPPETARA